MERFFSKSKVVMDWWMNILPMQQSPSYDDLKLNKQLDYSFLDNLTEVEIYEEYDSSWVLKKRMKFF